MSSRMGKDSPCALRALMAGGLKDGESGAVAACQRAQAVQMSVAAVCRSSAPA